MFDAFFDAGIRQLETDIPKFGEPIQNQTIAVGREAVFSCVVDNLQTYKVSLSSGGAFLLVVYDL
jgi:hypothetical protein